MRRRLATILLSLSLAAGAIVVLPGVVAASCTDNHITLYVDSNGGGGGAQSFCFELSGNFPNLNNIPGPCPQFAHANSWNDCVSSVRVSVSATQCIGLYRNANYGGVMVVYWGTIGPDVLFNVSPNDVLSSMKQYTKVPATPAGNC